MKVKPTCESSMNVASYAMLQPGQRIGRYVVLDRIGHGGTASVYRARHVELGSHHALKRIGVRRPRLLERLLAEGRAQARLQHPNVVRVTDVLEHEDAPVLVMEYVEGPSLESLVWNGPLELHLTLSVASGITRGLRAAHALGLAHRDLKPANVLLEPGEAGVVPRIADFGLVKVLRHDRDELRAPTRAGAAMGTPEFMAPEQIRDASTVDHRADLYSLGCILHLMLTGRVPVPADDLLAMYERMIAQPPPRPSARVHGVPAALDDLVVRLLAPEPADRPASCDEVLAVLESGAARVPSGRYPVRPAHLMAAARSLAPIWTRLHGPAPDREPRLPRYPAGLLLLPFVVPLVLASAALGIPPASPPPDPPSISGVVVAPAAPPGLRAPPRTPLPRPAGPAPVAITGEARRVWLIRSGRRYDVPGRVPPGRYEIVALFPDAEPRPAGEVVVRGDPVRLRCDFVPARCRRSP